MRHPETVGFLNAEELQQYIASHREGSYELVDVRQPAEFTQGHIPGAQLLPLPEFQQRLEQGVELPIPTDRATIFYCQAGSRSRIAARMALISDKFTGPLFSLDNGMLGWTGMSLDQQPRLGNLPLGEDLHTMLLAALDLEKAAFVLYAALEEESRRVGSCQLPEKLPEQMIDMELAHAKQVYRTLAKHWEEGAIPDFETLFGEAGGDVLEGGQKLAELGPWVAQALKAEEGCIGVAELGLEVEYAAYDLYRAVASWTRTAPNLSSEAAQEMEAVFLELAQQEKQHGRFLLDKLERMAAA